MQIRSSRALVTALPTVALLALAAGASSAQETRHDEAGLTLYSEAQYGGLHATLAGDAPTIDSLGANVQITSVRVGNPAASWELCEEANYGGRCVIVPSSQPNLARSGWIGRVRSARRIYGTANPSATYSLSGVELFGEPQFGGRPNAISANQRSLGDGTVQVRSLRVRGGTWELCENASFRGRCVLVAGDIPDVRAVGLPEGVGSLRLHVNLR